MTRSERPGAAVRLRLFATASGGALAALAVLSAAACLDDLPAATAASGADGGGDSGPVTVAPPSCGDGIVQRDAGEVCDPGPDASMSAAASCAPGACQQVLCPAGGFVDPTSDHCYFPLGGGHENLAASVSGCAALGAHVVTFDDAREESFVDDSFGDAGPYWIALQLVTPASTKPEYDVGSIDEPGWRSTCSGCYGQTIPAGAVDFGNVCKLGTVAGLAQCVAHAPAGVAYFGAPCSGTCGGSEDDAGAPVHALCEREPAGLSAQTCDDAGVCITVASTASMYELITDPLDESAASAVCRSKSGPGGAHGHLVVFQTAEERAQLSHELAARTQPGLPELTYWVGLENRGTSAIPQWTWVDGAPASDYAPEWADGEPTAGSLAYGLVALADSGSPLSRQLLQTDSNASTPRTFVCEFDGPDGGTP